MRNAKFLSISFAVLVLSLSTGAMAGEFAERKDAEALVGKAVTAMKANKVKTLEEINAGDAKWKDRDLYIQSFTMEGIVLAHGANNRLAGKAMLDLKDPTGKPFVKDQVELAKTKAKFWYDYSYTDPVSKKVLPKETYCERVGDALVCGGIYKR